MNLIVNADDYGLTKALNLGILEGFKNGVVTSTTMMANMQGFDHAVELYKQNDILKVGVHLTLTAGFPVCKDLKTIVSESGKFIDQRTFLKNEIKVDVIELKREFMAQIKKIKNAGIEIDHIDSHHHAHSFPIACEVVCDIAKELNLPIRPVGDFISAIKSNDLKMPKYFDQSFYGDNISEEYFISILSKYKDETLEVMVHPAYIDQDLIDSTSYSIKRALELKVLCSKKVKDFIKENNINLVNYTIFNK